MTRRHQIYFLQRADGLIKIGTSSNFKSRLASLGASHGLLGVVRVINGDAKRERSLHRKFHRFHEYGEWFRDERGALTAEIMALPDGDAVEVATTQTKADWIAGEAAFMSDVRTLIDDAISTHRQRTGLKREAALAALTVEYGFPKYCLQHVASGRASTISAFALHRLNEMRSAELQKNLDFLRSELAGLAADASTDEEILGWAGEIDAIERELHRRQASRAQKIAARKGRAA